MNKIKIFLGFPLNLQPKTLSIFRVAPFLLYTNKYYIEIKREVHPWSYSKKNNNNSL